ncbi:MAG: hypothetical protein HKN07_15880 [Acidimicrobiia bacterium]|nr:hypothetical protein [Acidimicrobiia bacterium]
MTQVQTAPVPAFAEETDRKLCLICSKGTLDMAYPGLVLANAALMEGIEVHMFFTFWGLDMINRDTMDDLKTTFLGNTAMHLPQGLGGVPGMTGLTTRMMKKEIKKLDFPEVPEFLQQIADAGGHLWACKMSVDMMHLEEGDLFDEVEGVIGATEFMEMSENGQIIFI